MLFAMQMTQYYYCNFYAIWFPNRYAAVACLFIILYYAVRKFRDGHETNVLTSYAVWVLITRLVNGNVFKENDLLFTVGMFIRYPRALNSSGRVNQWTNCVWHNLWNTSSNTHNIYSYSEEFSTKSIYDPCPTGYKVPTWSAFAGFNTANMVYTTVDGVTGRMYGDNLFFPFIPSTSQSTEFARYSTADFGGTASRTLFDFYTDYVYGRTGEAYVGNYVIRPGKE